MKIFKSKNTLLTHWLAIVGAGCAAAAAGFGYFNNNPYWAGVAFIAALLAIVEIIVLWRLFNANKTALTEAISECVQQKHEVDTLTQELEIHRRLERELTEAKQIAESAMMAKGEFLATMSHEIRTPLNGIIPMLDLLMSSKLLPDQHDFLYIAYTSAQQMLRIVDDILDYSKLEANKVQLESTNFNLRGMIDSVIQLMQKSAEAKGLRLNQQTDASVRLAVRGDAVRLRQVLTNLLSNAIKFTKRGAVSLHVSRKGETRTQHMLRFEIRDNGIGIAKQNIQNLFLPFSQANASTTRLYGGTGLGLVICKRIVDLMGGNIGVESELGHGATFWFEIPLLKVAGDIQEQRTNLNDGHVLLLSNDPPLRQRLRQTLPSWGTKLSEAETTHEALTQLRAALTHGNHWAFDLLIVDLHSMRSTAIALHRNLQNIPELAKLHVLYLQGNDPPSPELSQGQHVLMLPRMVGNTELRTAITDFMSVPAECSEEIAMPLPEATQTSTSEATIPVQLKGRVLLVEDNPVNQLVAKRLVGILGLTCETADHGEIAVEMMMANNYDLVLMDCQMPIKDGYTAAREWRTYELSNGLPHLPIIAMTANAMAGDRQKCLDAGMDDYLSKPVDRHLLEVTLTRWLTFAPAKEKPIAATAFATTPIPPMTASVSAPPSHLNTTMVSAPVVSHNKPTPSAVTMLMPLSSPPPVSPEINALSSTSPTTTSNVLAMDVVAELRAVMGPEYFDVIKLFLEDAPNHIHQLETAAASNNMAAMVTPAHTLKSSSANLGALALAEAAKRIELGARTGTLARPMVAVLVLEREFHKAQLALRDLLKG